MDAEGRPALMADLVVDTHIHLASDDEARYPRAEAEAYTNTAETYLKLMDEAGVTHATVVQPFGLYASDNSYQADSASAHPDRLRAICGLSPSPGAAAQVRYWVGERGMAGVRVNTRGEKLGLLDPSVTPLLEEAAALGVPVTIMMSRRHIENAHELARRHPTLNIALDHLGGAKPGLDNSFERLAALAAAPNIFLKLSTGRLQEPGARAHLRGLIDAFGAERIMWGSNYPVTSLDGYANTVRFALDALAFLSSAEQVAILGRSAVGLWPSLVEKEAAR
jgi:predicted TIM-barrel fold metal-dependent hydrolase